MRRIGLSALCALALVGASAASAAETTVRAEVAATTVGIEDTVPLVVTIEGAHLSLKGEVEAPALDNLEVVGGPSVSTQVSIVNGSFSQSRSYTWLLRPVRVGAARIGAVKVELDAGPQSTDPIVIDVVKGSVAPPPQPQQDPFARFMQEDPLDAFFGRRQAPGAVRVPKVVVEAVPSRRRLHVGEPLLLTYYLLTQASISGLDFEQAPQYPGFWAEDLEQPKNPQGEPVVRDGERFRRFPVYVKLLFPTRAGTLTIPPARLKVGVVRPGGFFAPMGAGMGPLESVTDPVSIVVEGLPEAVAATGAVGRFDMTATVDRRTLAVGDAATVTVTLRGTGNLKWIDAAPPLAVDGAKVYPPQSSSDIRAGVSGLAGSRTWEYVVVPETAGRHTVPALRFAYFDPSENAVEEARTEPIHLEASPAVAAGAVAQVADAAGGGLRLRGETDASIAPSLGGGVVGAVLVLALLLHVGLWAGVRWPGVARARLRPSAGGARRAATELRRASDPGLPKETAAGLIERAIVEVFGEPEAAAGSERDREVSAILREARFIRYAPQLGDYSESLRRLVDRARGAVRRWA